MEKERKRYTHKEWLKEAERRFGKDFLNWKFVCPSCGYVAEAREWRDAGAETSNVAFSCVGRWSGHMDKDMGAKDGGPCNYAGGGLFRLNPVEVVMPDGEVQHVFDFAEVDNATT